MVDGRGTPGEASQTRSSSRSASRRRSWGYRLTGGSWRSPASACATFSRGFLGSWGTSSAPIVRCRLTREAQTAREPRPRAGTQSARVAGLAPRARAPGGAAGGCSGRCRCGAFARVAPLPKMSRPVQALLADRAYPLDDPVDESRNARVNTSARSAASGACRQRLTTVRSGGQRLRHRVCSPCAA